MASIGSIHPVFAAPLARVDAPVARPGNLSGAGQPATPTTGFGEIFDGALTAVQGKQEAAQAATRRVLMGDSDQVHQSVIAMQEASVAFTMMVEVRNKLVESYQELMRMQI